MVVSTDSEKIADIASSYGAEIPFIRPHEYALDDTPGALVVTHALKWLLENEGNIPEYTMLLQPTSPLRTWEDIDNAIDLLNEEQSTSVISVSPVEQHPYLMKCVSENNVMKNFCETTESPGNRQSLDPVYVVNGAIYMTLSEKLVNNPEDEKQPWYDNQSVAYIMPADRSIDIDTEQDLVIARYLCGKY